MKVPTEIAEKVAGGTIQEMYNVFITLFGEYDEFDTDYEKVRNGITVEFEIQDLWENTTRITRKDKMGKVIINQKVYKLSDFRTEKEMRRKIMAEAIMNNLATQQTIEPR